VGSGRKTADEVCMESVQLLAPGECMSGHRDAVIAQPVPDAQSMVATTVRGGASLTGIDGHLCSTLSIYEHACKPGRTPQTLPVDVREGCQRVCGAFNYECLRHIIKLASAGVCSAADTTSIRGTPILTAP